MPSGFMPLTPNFIPEPNTFSNYSNSELNLDKPLPVADKPLPQQPNPMTTSNCNMCVEYRTQYAMCKHMTKTIRGCHINAPGEHCTGPSRHATLLINTREVCPWCLIQDKIKAGLPVTDDEIIMPEPVVIEGPVVIPANVESAFAEGNAYDRVLPASPPESPIIRETQDYRGSRETPKVKKPNWFKRHFSKTAKDNNPYRLPSAGDEDKKKACIVM